MARNVEAVIAALKIALDEAKKSSAQYVKPSTANRWIDQLPGAWTGRWSRLRSDTDHYDAVDRKAFIGHLRATIAYLEVNREAIQRQSSWWTWRSLRSTKQRAEPIDAEFTEVDPTERQASKPGLPIRLIK